MLCDALPLGGPGRGRRIRVRKKSDWAKPISGKGFGACPMRPGYTEDGAFDSLVLSVMTTLLRYSIGSESENVRTFNAVGQVYLHVEVPAHAPRMLAVAWLGLTPHSNCPYLLVLKIQGGPDDYRPCFHLYITHLIFSVLQSSRSGLIRSNYP